MSVQPELRVLSPRAFAKTAAEAIATELQSCVQERTIARIALAGGGTPKATYEMLAGAHAESVPWSDVYVYFGDERCVKADDSSSNYRMATDSLLSKVAIPETNVMRINGELPPAEAAADYANLIGDAPLDIILLGMGTDGHTASLFPSTELGGSETVLATTSPVPPKNRISLGLEAINGASVVIFLITGSGKADRVHEVHQQILAGTPELPAAHVQPRSGRLIWLLDTDAASTLERHA